ncbi:hypothetical protein HAX54_043896, partial [Datura stramonium]|nr:hypothetical protein [Datura stramonium]
LEFVIGVSLVELLFLLCTGLMGSQGWVRLVYQWALGLVDIQRTRVFPAEGLSPRVDRPMGLRMMSSVVSNQDMIRKWSN